MRGDSWIKKEAIIGLCGHQSLQILHMGHVEHSDMYCEKLDLVAHNKESPIDLIIEVALAIEAKGHLPSLCTLWIEEC